MTLSNLESSQNSDRPFRFEDTRGQLANLKQQADAKAGAVQGATEKLSKDEQAARKQLESFSATGLGVRTRDAIVSFILQHADAAERPALMKALGMANLEQVLIYIHNRNNGADVNTPVNIFDLGITLQQALKNMGAPGAGLLKEIEETYKKNAAGQ